MENLAQKVGQEGRYDLSELWQKALDIMGKQLSKASFETWIKPAKPIDLENYTMVIEVSNEFAKDWLERRYYDLIKDSIEEVLNQEISLCFIVVSNPEYMPSTVNKNKTYLNPKYTFDTFVAGDNNRFAHAAAIAVAESPAKAYNPLFIYGGVGLGKTHLMQAIGNFALKRDPEAKVAYLSSEKFTDELISAIRDDKTFKFRDKYRNMDMLLIDDIQFLAGKERTQEEFFHTFNALYEANKQIVIASDRSPEGIPALGEGLRSRFKGGIIAEIQPPDPETRIEFLSKRVELENIQVPYEVITYIANRIQLDIRELDGVLTRVFLHSSVKQSPITVNLAAEVLKDIPPLSLRNRTQSML
ncbi:MAG: chromosomal replication initiator protein DnaA [Firmicutes bacterium HGW-Firmicutes-14]|nr:MAG: chromosomal replication initiator protein DnaA [Firmicutes bacterium HGW-Firmicutes-14]